MVMGSIHPYGISTSSQASPASLIEDDDHVIAIDQGTTSTRAIVYSLPNFVKIFKVQQRVSLKHYNEHLKEGWIEQDPLEILDSVSQCLDQVLSYCNSASLVAKRIGLTNQRETTIAWRRSTGLPLSPAISWMDTRTKEMALALTGSMALQKMTGLVAASCYPSALKMKWLMETVPEVKEAAKDKDLCLGTVDSWLLFKLTNSQLFVTDVTNAHRTQLVEIDEPSRWSEDLLDYFEIDPSWLPTIVDSVVRPIALATKGDVSIMAVMGDQHASLYGHGCTPGDGYVKCTYGTGCFVMRVEPRLPNPNLALLTTLAYFNPNHFDFKSSHPNDSMSYFYAREGPVASAATCLEWAVKALYLDSVEELCELAKEGKDGVLVNPSMSGLLAPRWDPGCKGSVHGLTLATSREDIARGFLNSIAFSVALIVKEMQPKHETEMKYLEPLHTLLVDGGLSKSDLLMQIQANVLQLPVVRPKDQECTSLGIAKAASGYRPIKSNHVDVFEPCENELLIRLFEEWIKMLPGITPPWQSTVSYEKQSQVTDEAPKTAW